MAIKKFVLAKEGPGEDPSKKRIQRLDEQVKQTRELLKKAKESDPKSERVFNLQQRVNNLTTQKDRAKKRADDKKERDVEKSSVPYEEGFVTTELVCYWIPTHGGQKVERWRKKVYYPVAEQQKCFDKLMLKTVGPFLYDLQGKTKWTPKKPRGVPPWDNF